MNPLVAKESGNAVRTRGMLASPSNRSFGREIATKIVMEVSNFMMKNMGWRFAPPELTEWQRHIGIDNPGLMRGVAEKYFMKSKGGRVWMSNGSGRAELETDEIAPAQILIGLPGEVLSLRTTTANPVEGLKQIVEALERWPGTDKK